MAVSSNNFSSCKCGIKKYVSAQEPLSGELVLCQLVLCQLLLWQLVLWQLIVDVSHLPLLTKVFRWTRQWCEVIQRRAAALLLNQFGTYLTWKKCYNTIEIRSNSAIPSACGIFCFYRGSRIYLRWCSIMKFPLEDFCVYN